MKTPNINELKSIYPQLNTAQVSRRSLLALGSIFALELAGCGGRGQDQSNPPAPPPSYTNAGVVTTLAGSTTEGYTDGTGSVAQFSYPSDLAVDANGTIYVSDGSKTIRKITAAGVVTTLAGSTSRGYQDGTGSAALFDNPRGLAVGANGTIYVADCYNHVIRKITSEGVVTTFAGIPLQIGYDDGPGASATFWSPTGIAIDAAGNLYVADSNNNLIRKISPTGDVTTIAGAPVIPGDSLDGTGVNARFKRPYGITIDANSNLYVADQFNNMIRMISPAGVVTTLAGATTSGGVDDVGSAARFTKPMGISIDGSGNLYVVEYDNSAIRKIVIATRTVTTFAGDMINWGYVDATGAAARFAYSQGVAVGSDGYIYVADTYNHMIRKLA